MDVIAKFLVPLPIPLFVDTKSIVPGEKGEDRIIDAMQEATHVYVFWSEHADASEWVKKEIDLAINDEKTVIPALIDDTRLPDGLSRLMGIDIRFVAGVNRGLFDVGHSSYFTDVGMRTLEQEQQQEQQGQVYN